MMFDYSLILYRLKVKLSPAISFKIAGEAAGHSGKIFNFGILQFKIG
jgi:hypothetical protein